MKRYISYAVCVLLLAAGVCFGGCDDSAPLGREPSLTAVHRKPVAVTGVTLDRTSLLLSKGDTVTLTATVLPENATDRSVRWSSSDTSVATVSSEGQVTAVSAGTATITATSVSDTSVKATCTVTVADTNGHEYVDLGLTSGTLWATCNVGASSPSDYGNYYAWGEIATKVNYAPSYYSYSSNPTTLPLDRDAARVNWGGRWFMPSQADFQELYDECTWTWTTVNGKNGYKVSGANNNYIFLPAAGHYCSSSLTLDGSYGYYWSSSLNTSDTSCAYGLFFYSSNIDLSYWYRYDGQCVRPVFKKEVAVIGVTLDKTSLLLSKGETASLIATVLPYAADCSVIWNSSDTSIATVSNDGMVKAISAGTATITATSVSDTSVKATCTVTVLEMNVDGQENGHDFVDLGLTSGTLWATCNVGASSPSDYGNYYAWGEIAIKSNYTSSNYNYSSDPTTLPLDRDAARANWGGNWLIPTKADFQELYNECTWTWTTINGKNGCKVSSKKNNNFIFLPAAGYFGSSLGSTGLCGFYWSSSLCASSTSDAYALSFDSNDVDSTYHHRYNGQIVRPVLRKEVAVTGVTLDRTSLSLFKGETATLIATVLPEDATDRSVTWSSSNPSVATVSSAGKVTAVSAGTATITATSVSDTSVKATCTVTVLEMNVDGQENGHDYVDLGLNSGILWATCNVGASSPTDYGNYYAWGETATKSSYEESNYSYSSNPTTLPVDRDAARANWGGSWLMPTKADFQELYNECTWTWTTINGKNGYKVSSKKNSSYIFLPVAGHFGSSLYNAGSGGKYWSSSLSTSITSYAYLLDFYSRDVNPSYYGGRYFGQSVRPVLRKEVAVTGVTLDQTSLSLFKGGTATLIATVLPEDATDRSVTWSSSNPSVATVSSAGKVTAVSAGTTTITATSVSDTSVKATCTVTVTANSGGQENGHEYVDLGLTSGTLWATCNVGASSPSDYGNYYAWGETTTKSSYTESNYSYSSYPTTLPVDRDAARANWGGSWLMPTMDDFLELCNECTWTWTTMDGKNCCKVSSKKNSSYIFLPAAGYFGSSLNGAGTSGSYWSSSLYTSSTSRAYELSFILSLINPTNDISRYRGQCVRPVLKNYASKAEKGNMATK